MVIKVTDDLGVRDSHRAAGSDLLFEQGNDAAVGPQDIAEPHATYSVLERPSIIWMIISQTRLVAPMTLVD